MQKKVGEEARSVREVCDVCAAHGDRAAVGVDVDTQGSNLCEDETHFSVTWGIRVECRAFASLKGRLSKPKFKPLSRSLPFGFVVFNSLYFRSPNPRVSRTILKTCDEMVGEVTSVTLVSHPAIVGGRGGLCLCY